MMAFKINDVQSQAEKDFHALNVSKNIHLYVKFLEVKLNNFRAAMLYTTRWNRLDVRFNMITEPCLCDEYFLRYR